MRAYEFITEAQGGMWDRMLEKRSGATIQFTKDDKTYDLLEVVVFPQEKERLAYELNVETNQTPDQQLTNDINEYLKAAGVPQQAPIPKKSNAAAMVVILGDKANKVAYIKYVKSKKNTHPPIYWQTSEFQRDSGWTQTNTGKSATSKAAELKINPYQFVTPDQKYSITQLPSLVESNLKSRTGYPQPLISGIPALLKNIIAGTETPVPNIEQYASTLEVVLGETAAPLALATGHNVSGSYQQAEREMISTLGKGLTWKSFTQTAFGAHGAAIGDSTLYAGNVSVIISSKNAKGGAAASLTGAMETIKRYPEEFGKGTQFYNTYRDIMPILEILDSNNRFMGPVQVAVHYGWITQEEANFFMSNIYSKGKMNPSVLDKHPGLKALYEIPRKVDSSNPKYQLGFHILSTIAVKIKQELNKDLKLITDFFKGVLNKAAMVQVYTKMGQNDQGIWFNDFDVVWPPVFAGNIIVESDFFTAQAVPAKKLSFFFK